MGRHYNLHYAGSGVRPTTYSKKISFAVYLSEHSPAANDAAIKTFATNFNSEKVARDSSLVKGMALTVCFPSKPDND